MQEQVEMGKSYQFSESPQVALLRLDHKPKGHVPSGMVDSIDIVLQFFKNNPDVATLIIVIASIFGIIAAGFTIYMGAKVVGKDLIGVAKQIGKAKRLATAVASSAAKCWRVVCRRVILARTKWL